MEQSANRGYWAVRLGEAGYYVPWARKSGYVAIGWIWLGDLSWLPDTSIKGEDRWKKLKNHYKDTSDSTEVSTRISCGIVWNFVIEMIPKDIVLIPDPQNRTVLIGEICGDYEYKENWDDDCEFTRRRKFTLLKEVSRDDISERLKSSLTCPQTVFSLDAHKNEIEHLISGEIKPEAVSIPSVNEGPTEITGGKLAVIDIDKLFDLAPKEFQEFIAHVLSLIGFQAASTEYVGDKGIDVVGTLNAEGFANIVLKIQVKRVKSSIGIDEVQRTRGAISADEHGAYVTLSTFTKEAQREAQAEKKKPIALIDGEDLASLVLKYYADLEEKYKRLLPLKKFS